MRIYAVADIHADPGKLGEIKENTARYEPDVIVVAGDIGSMFGPADAPARHLNALQVPVFAVFGNTDFRLKRRLADYPDITVLHINRVKRGGIFFCGVSGCLPVPFRSRIMLSERGVAERMGRLAQIPSLIAVHPPPYGILDKVMGKLHAGSGAVRQIVQKCRPAVLVCGHIHENAGIAKLDDTLVVNCAMSRRSSGALIEMDTGGGAEAELLAVRQS